MLTSTICLLTALAAAPDGDWQKDFARQPITARPPLEVRYESAARTAFSIEAAAYRLRGELRAPHRLIDVATGREWLRLAVEADDGRVLSAANASKPSRINLYRRGPYHCEVHWLDLRVADGDGRAAPLRGDVTLHCWPDKILVSVTWHATADFAASFLIVEGLEKRREPMRPFRNGEKQTVSWALFGETPPLAPRARETLEATRPLRYDARRGCYVIGSHNPGAFDGHFFRHPNHYETVRFRVRNDATPRTVWVCHETVSGAPGTVEGGVLLDSDGHPLPIVVQISKNFAGEKEERFYNPRDTAFSETYFPLCLESGETCTVASLHLYQNWGRHMVKQFSSLGAWMDYFHSSTGVTETTCYVPFKFGGLKGLDIADLRAMSQATFWRGQPQHDNIAGHSFLSYRADGAWRYLEYRGTTYHSTGPNWMDIELRYRSSDECVEASVRTFELPQADELRNFVRVRYRFVKPLTVRNALEDFRLLRIASYQQRLRYARFAATDVPDRDLDFSRDGFPVRGVRLPARNAFAALYGEAKGSNAFVIRDWQCRVRGASFGPAASVRCEKSGKTRLLIVPDAETVRFEAGDEIVIDGYWLAYGPTDSAATPRREVVRYGSEAPRVESVTRGRKVADFPSVVAADGNEAEFALRGGRDVVPVIVTGLSDYRWPRIERRESRRWAPIPHSRVGDLDGVQVFCQRDGRYGAVFLVRSTAASQRLRVTAGAASKAAERISVRPLAAGPDDPRHVALIRAPWMERAISFRFPETVATDRLEFIDHHREDMPSRVPSAPLAQVWRESEAGSLWFEWAVSGVKIGGRLTPNEEDVDLELWLENGRRGAVDVGFQLCPVLAGTAFADASLERTWIHTGGAWKAMSATDRGKGRRELCHYPVEGGPPLSVGPPWGASSDSVDAPVVAVTSPDGKYVFAIAWPRPRSVLSNADLPCVHADPVLPKCPPRRRVHVRGKLYLFEGTLDDLLARVRRDIGE